MSTTHPRGYHAGQGGVTMPGKGEIILRPYSPEELSYREKALLGRDLKPEEVREVMRMARRIAAILLLQPQLDANYLAVKGDTYEWGAGG